MGLGCFASLGPQDINMSFSFISSQNQENCEQMQNSPDFTRFHYTRNRDTHWNQQQFKTEKKNSVFYTAGNEFLEYVPALSSFLPLMGEAMLLIC